MSFLKIAPIKNLHAYKYYTWKCKKYFTYFFLKRWWHVKNVHTLSRMDWKVHELKKTKTKKEKPEEKRKKLLNR